MIAWYQRAFAWKPSPCRFYPSCSNYVYEAIEIHGPRKGGWLGARRLWRCRPFGGSGIDLVPEREGTPDCRHRGLLPATDGGTDPSGIKTGGGTTSTVTDFKGTHS